MPAYLIVNYKVDKPDLYGEYAAAAGPAMKIGEACQLLAFDAKTGEEIWLHNIGIAQRGSPTVGDGKIYVGQLDGKLLALTRELVQRLKLVHCATREGGKSRQDMSKAVSRADPGPGGSEDGVVVQGSARGRARPPETARAGRSSLRRWGTTAGTIDWPWRLLGAHSTARPEPPRRPLG